MAVGGVVIGEAKERAPHALGTEVDVAGEGHALRITWAPVAGATAAEVGAATLAVRPADVRRAFPDLLQTACSKAAKASIAAPAGWRIVALSLDGLKVFRPTDPAEGAVVRSAADLAALGLRLVVSPGGTQPPLFSVPQVGARGMIPATLRGAAFEAPSASAPGLLTLPEAPRSLALALATGNVPEEFAPQTMSLASAPGEAVIGPRNLHVTDPAGADAWAFPGELPAGTDAGVDLRFAIEKELNARIAGGAALDVTFRLKGDDPSRAAIRWSGAHGALRRDVPGVTTVAIEGAPRALPLDGPLADETPASARADVVVTYLGLRLSEFDGWAQAPTPTAPAVIEGVVIRGDALVRRALPPVALTGPPIARIGLFGRAPEPCELAVQFAAPAGAPSGAPGVVKIEPAAGFDLVWFELPAPPAPGASELVVRANKGRFFWAAGPNGPLVRLAVRDPDPGGRPLKLGASTLVEVREERHEFKPKDLPAAAFRGAAPVLSSDLFLKIELADLALRYSR